MRHKGLIMTAVLLVALIAVVPAEEVIRRAPPITSIETDFAVSHVLRDAGDMMSLEQNAEAMRQSPVVYANGASTLEESLAPPPAPSPTPEPTPEPTPDPVEALGIKPGVTVIGDSVALGAEKALTDAIPDCVVDAEVSRAVSTGHSVMMQLQAKGELREYVVIAMGTNGAYNYADLLTRYIDDLEPGHRLIFVTPFDGRKSDNGRITADTAAWERDLPDTYDFVTIADWATLISTQTKLLGGDKVHMGGPEAKALYAQCVSDALAAAAEKPYKQP